jgi:predicted LPLAT superfamily acyltransferase
VADRHFPGVRQTLDDSHLREHLDVFANLHDPNNPTGAKAWVDQTMGALLMNRVGEVLSALKRMRPWQKAIHDALAQLIGSMERHRTRIRDQDSWHTGLAVGSGAVEGGCKHVMQSRCKRAGMRWKQPGFLHVLA